MSDQLARAMIIATDAHEGQMRKGGILPYIIHPSRVADLLETETEKAIAWLHDVIEDTPLTFVDLMDKGVNALIRQTVWILTHNKKANSYEEYIQIVSENPLAKRIKIADIVDNLSDSPTKKQIKKAYKALLILLGDN